jgi:hypothetical protein
MFINLKLSPVLPLMQMKRADNRNSVKDAFYKNSEMEQQ